MKLFRKNNKKLVSEIFSAIIEKNGGFVPVKMVDDIVSRLTIIDVNFHYDYDNKTKMYFFVID